MPVRFDVIVIDLDGTLLGPDGSVSACNRSAIDMARAEGIEIVVATGRAYCEARPTLDAIRHDGLMVAAGGSLLSDAADGSTLARSAMCPGVVREIADSLIDDGHRALILKDASVTGYDYLTVGPHDLDDASSWWFRTQSILVRHVDRLEDDPHPDDTVRTGAVACASRLAPLARRLILQMAGRAFLQHWGAVTAQAAGHGETHLLEVFNPEVNKWTMIEQMCRDRGIDPARVATIGDGLNDLEMVENASLGIAMENADRRVLDVADRVTASNVDDGVTHAIERILGGDW